MPQAEVAGTTLHYIDEGSGAVALFIHGFPLDATMWRDQVDRLSAGRRCIAVDLRGFGRSAAVTADVLPMERHADDLAALLDHLDVARCDVVALSMGGYVALAMAQLHAARVRSLALIDTRAEADSEEGKAGRGEAARRLMSHGRRHFAESMLPALVAPAAPTIVRARLRTMMEGCRYETIIAALAGMRLRPDRTGILGRLDVPAVVVVGEHDAITPPAAAKAMTAAIPGASLHVIPGAGHMAPMEAPDAVAAVLRDHFSMVDG